MSMREFGTWWWYGKDELFNKQHFGGKYKLWSHFKQYTKVIFEWIKKLSVKIKPLHRSQPCYGIGVCITYWNYEPCHAGPPKTDRSYWRVLTVWSTGGRNGNPLQYSCLENPMDTMKKQKYMKSENEPPRSSLEIFSRKLEIWRDYFVPDGHNKGQKCYGPKRKD